MNIIILMAGDVSGDGHMQTETHLIECNLDQQQLQEAYKKGTKLVGFNLTKDVCEDFEDHELPEAYRKKLAKHKISVTEEDLDATDFAKLYMEICKLGDSNLVWNFADRVKYPTIEIGGYGLFFG